ncbi:N-acetylglucosamine-6-phosphate deacetylase [candidate division KSB3 bacterium]|uniref:N-acetylglucosamine-6-phosphate deacetylase n=1 Tax=candidate division KSB3 bacterium TaxID=2044937 RepID=A0A9D5Q4M1_9BACT|nr:N-acetylglucosamine-6-phosphate deacetylase [candidate division KSB3 bacterium]MBD3323337.1 N-acetylglucosamine-6-phosphate deacetylase [candidate division KSB3 bacterium]
MILHGTLYTPYTTIRPGWLQIEGTRIARVSSTPIMPHPEEEVWEFSDAIIAPGFINLHVHGGAGADVMDATPEALTTIARHQLHQGVTTFLPTTVSAGRKTLCHVLAVLQAYCASQAHGASAEEEHSARLIAHVAGIHVEGPFLSLDKKGAQSERSIRSYDEVQTLDALMEFIASAGDQIRILTLAPEHRDAECLIRLAIEHGITVGLGHSIASFEHAQEAISSGVRYATHTFNAMPPVHHRQPGLVTAVLLDDRVYAELIADGIHLHPAICQLVLKVKGEDRSVLVTDAVRCAGMPDGEYRLGDLPIIKSGNAVFLRDTSGDTLAGSVLSMNRGIELLVRQGQYTLQQALKAASTNPAHVLRIEEQKGSLTPGKDADIVVLGEDFRVNAVVVQGRIESMENRH